MKNLKNISLNDFKEHPIWKYYYDHEHDVSRCSPWSVDKELESDSDYVVGCEIKIADGTKYGGYFLYDHGDSGDDRYICLTIKHANLDIMPVTEIKVLQNEALELLGKEYSDVFPISYKSLALVNGREISDTITSPPGFWKTLFRDFNLRSSFLIATIYIFFISGFVALITDIWAFYIVGYVSMTIAFLIFSIPTIIYCYRPNKKVADWLNKQGMIALPKSVYDPVHRIDIRESMKARLIYGTFLLVLLICWIAFSVFVIVTWV